MYKKVYFILLPLLAIIFFINGKTGPLTLPKGHKVVVAPIQFSSATGIAKNVNAATRREQKENSNTIRIKASKDAVAINICDYAWHFIAISSWKPKIISTEPQDQVHSSYYHSHNLRGPPFSC